MREKKKLVPNPQTKDIIVRVFDLYLEGKSHQAISNIYNEEKILGKTWYSSTIQKILCYEIYKGDYLHGKRTKHPTYYENVVEPLVSKEKWESCQEQKKRNARHYERTSTYLFTNKLKCSTCGCYYGGKASTKIKRNKKYYYYKCCHCKTNLREENVEEELINYILAILQMDELLNNYYTPFIKSKMDLDKVDYQKQLKELDKEVDRIKAAYIKGIVKMDSFDNELKQIEFKRKELLQKQKEQKQYESLNFTVDDLLVVRDKQIIDNYIHPENIIHTFTKWITLSREEKQKIISTYIDDVEIEKIGEKIEIKNINLRETLFEDMRNYHIKYNTPLDLYIFEDESGSPIPIAHGELRTREQAKEYANKLKKFYDVNYYEVIPNDDLTDMSFQPKNQLEKVIRFIPLKNEKTYHQKRLELGILTINLSNVLDKNNHLFYQERSEKLLTN